MTDAILAVPPWLDREAWPFAPRSAALEAGRMHYVDEGAGEPVLFVHGTPTWGFEWRHLIRALSRRWRCIVPDHLGFGLSERPAGFAYTPEAHAAALSEFVARLGLDSLALVVHDFGGPIGLPLALEGRASRVVILNSWMWPLGDDPGMRARARLVGGALGRFLYRRMNASLRLIMPSAYGDRAKLTPAIHRQYLEPFRDPVSRVRVLWALARALLGSHAHYASLLARAARLREVPVHIVWGMKDSAFRPAQLERWRTLVPHASVERIEDAGHWPHEEAPERVATSVREFLERSAS